MRRAVLPLAAACAIVLAGCGNTLQVKPVSHSVLEGMIVAPFPVYWLGGSFQGLAVSEATHDASGSFSVQYGNCLQGGQDTCIPPLRIVTSPDNSFLPGGETPARTTRIRGLSARVSDAGRIISLVTGPVVLDIYAERPSLALAAASTAVAINRAQSPGQALPSALPDSGFGSKPLPSQLPATIRPPATS